MAITKHSTFRLPESDLKLVDREARRLSKETGLKVSRTDVLKRVIRENLQKAPEKPGRR